MTERFRAFFEAATGVKPYPYQGRLAAAESLGGGLASFLIDVPAGAGKTAGGILAWRWNHCGRPGAAGEGGGSGARVEGRGAGRSGVAAARRAIGVMGADPAGRRPGRRGES